MKEKILTLSIVYKHPKVLLGYKKRGFGKGMWDGFGGKVEEGESVEDGALRELEEESGLVAKDFHKTGEFSVEFKDNQEKLKVYVFKVTDFSGEEKETEEMKPKWFFIDEIPFKEMWPDVVHWMPLFFSGRSFKGHFVFEKEKTLVGRSVEVTGEF